MPSVSSGSDRVATNAQAQLTRVNGIGLWNSWTRNFKTPLLALLDLIDNSVDAAYQRFPVEPEGSAPGSLGAGHTAVDQQYLDVGSLPQRPSAKRFRGKIYVDTDTTLEGGITGIKVTNNSVNPIKDLGRIMEVYSSSKGRVEHGVEVSQDNDMGKFAETVGENGVGLKQGCATLSDLSFVLMRNGRNIGMAIIAQRLQSEAGVYLPHFNFQATELQALKNEMRNIFASSNHRKEGDCVSAYGGGSLESGVNRLLRHYADLSEQGLGSWGREENVFCVVLHQLKHGSNIDATSEESDAQVVLDAKEKLYSGNAQELMKELRDGLPRNYIHINMEVRVGDSEIQFHYWQRRLVEMTMFFVQIDQNNSYMSADDWKDPIQSYPLRIFCGFDAVRLNSNDRSSACSLNIYSRSSGRLIKHEEDARALLKLSSGGTEYSQAFTVVVDDMLGNLPLNPTKQDVAFGEQAHGDIHKRNLYAWLSAIAKTYYKYHLDSKCNGKKADLTRKVKAFGIPMITTRLKPLDQSTFTEFLSMNWKVVKNVIQPMNRRRISVNIGPDTLLRITADRPAEKLVRKKKSRASIETEEKEAEQLQAQPSKRHRREIDYNEDEDDAFEVQIDADVDDADALPVVDLDAPGIAGEKEDIGTGETEDIGTGEINSVAHVMPAREDSAWSRHELVKEEEALLEQETKALQSQNKTLRDAVKRNKEKASERKKIIRQMDKQFKELRARFVELQQQQSGNCIGKTKNSREMQLEEQVDQLTDALAQQQQQNEELEKLLRARDEEYELSRREQASKTKNV